MGNLTQLTLETGTVQDAYSKMVQRSEEMHDFLDTVESLLMEVDDQDTKMYVGDKSPSVLRDELTEFAKEFAPVYAEIQIFANNINSILRTSTEQ